MRLLNCFNKIILTTGTLRQKKICEKLIASDDGLSGKNITVVPDDAFGCRIGSGGAVINAVSEYYEDNCKMLIINSGGFSKRCINYSVPGKAFAGLKYNGEEVFLLQVIIRKAEQLLEKISDGVFICCSDILVETGDVGIPFTDNTGFCNRSDLTTASRHGVMVAEGGLLKYYLHKESPEQLKKYHGSDSALVDTGMIYFTGGFASEICRLEKNEGILSIIKSEKIEINLYPEIVALLSSSTDEETYYAEDLQGEKHLALRKLFYRYFSPFGLKVCEIKNENFIHFGTAAESLRNIKAFDGHGCATLINSFTADCVLNVDSVIENALLEGCTVGAGSFVSNVMLSGVSIPDNTLVCGIRLTSGSFVTVCCDVCENPKSVINGTELWNVKRYYKGKTFTDSLLKFFEKAEEDVLSPAEITGNADYEYFLNRYELLKNLNYHYPCREYSEIREKTVAGYFGEYMALKLLEPVKDYEEKRLPVRVNFSGTWTDAMPYCTENGGQVVNMAVTVGSELPVFVSAKKLSEPVIRLISDSSEAVFNVSETGPRYHDDFDDFILHKAALRVFGINEETEIKEGICLTARVSGIMHGSGLGVSSILLYGCFSVLSGITGIRLPEEEKIRMTFVAEQLMKTGGGWQDQTAAACQGVCMASSQPGIVQNVRFSRLHTEENLRQMLNSRLCIVSTGQRHFGRYIVTDIMNRYLSGDSAVRNALDGLYSLNSDVIRTFEKGDISMLSDCLNRQFRLLKELSPEISNENIEKIVRECESIADGVCICGAGAGGYLLLVLKEGVTPEMLEAFGRKAVFGGIENPVLSIKPYETDDMNQ